MLNVDAKVEITPVPFGGGGELVPNLLGGHVDLGFISVSPIKPHVAAGKMRILAVLSTTRLPDYPQVPATYEKGYSRTIISTGIGLLGPKGLSPGIVKRWEDVTEATLKDPNILSTLQRLDYVIDFRRGEDFKKNMMSDLANFKEIIAKSGIKK
jgi:tripartite-type tricarboxylate transporter receptor subunit TctC